MFSLYFAPSSSSLLFLVVLSILPHGGTVSQKMDSGLLILFPTHCLLSDRRCFGAAVHHPRGGHLHQGV